MGQSYHICGILYHKRGILYHKREFPGNPYTVETQHHTTSLVFCFMCFLNKVLSLAVSQPKLLSTLVYLLHDLVHWMKYYHLCSGTSLVREILVIFSLRENLLPLRWSKHWMRPLIPGEFRFGLVIGHLSRTLSNMSKLNNLEYLVNQLNSKIGTPEMT